MRNTVMRKGTFHLGSILGIGAIVITAIVITAVMAPSPVSGQLVECEQVDANGNIIEVGGCIAKNLQDQIGTGHGDVLTPGSSVYLIKRDPARSIRRGRQLFQRKFTAFEGQGPRVNFTSTGDITQSRALGAGLSDSCAACHGRPRGAAGHGGDVNTFPDSRDAPHLFGLGLVEMLADEMTADLRALRDQALDDAANGTGALVLIDADFDDSTDGFSYADDTFNNTNNPSYAAGARAATTVPGDAVLQVRLGNVNDFDIIGMSGGWQRSFEVASATDAVLSLRYNLVQSPEYESDEFSQALIAVDGTVFELATVTGDGNGGPQMTTGRIDVEIPLSLSAGTHTLSLGGFNNKKTLSNELTDIFYNNVLLTGTGAPGPVTRELETKGVSFGTITAFPDGTVDTSGVEGVNADLRVRPFFHQGGTVTMREFIVGALNAEMGLQAWDPVLCAVTDPIAPQAMTSPSGFVYDPAVDDFERPPACSAAEDSDGDGVTNEIDPALVDHLEFYLLNYFKPGQYRVTARAQQGLALMEQIGCTSCHVKSLTVESDRRVADVETVYDPVNGIFNQLFATASTRFGDPIDDGDPFPQLPPSLASFVVDNLFSDLKRHDLGPAFHERDFDGGRITEHVTEPLWGVATSAPYGHDGRSVNLDAVIRRHGGEAASASQSYASLSEGDQLKILEFLGTLVLFPPDDTASNLNPGVPGSSDPQDPANHGNINLGVLFQIPGEGGE